MAAFSISFSLNKTWPAAGPSGMKVSALATRADRSGEPALDQRGDHPFAHAAGVPGLVHHQHPAGVAAAAASMSATGNGASQRRSRTSAAMPFVGQPAGHPQTHRHPVAERDHGQIARRSAR